MAETTAAPALTIGRASYPPSYHAPGAVLERAYRQHLRARVNSDEALVDLARNTIDSAISRAERGA